jgi:hypothetical protein
VTAAAAEKTLVAEHADYLREMLDACRAATRPLLRPGHRAELIDGVLVVEHNDGRVLRVPEEALADA